MIGKSKEEIQRLIDSRSLIESGWWGVLSCIPETASEAQRNDMKAAYYAGVAQLWHIIMTLTGNDENDREEMAIMKSLDEEIAKRIKSVLSLMTSKLNTERFTQ